MNTVNLQDIKSTHRNPLHSYTLNNEKIEREIKETIPFTIAMERIKYLGINLPKETNLACCNSWGRKESNMTERLK